MSSLSASHSPGLPGRSLGLADRVSAWRRRPSTSRPARLEGDPSARSGMPLSAALSIGLGCDGNPHHPAQVPEWRR